MQKTTLEKDFYDFLKKVSSTGTESLRREASEILSENFNRNGEYTSVQEYEPVEITGAYTVDRDNEEDEKWEGLKEINLAKEIGHDALRRGLIVREKISPENSRTEKYKYTLKVLKRI